MRICFIAEGCYPYVVGGVSSWVHSMIKNFPNQEFILLTIVANREASGKFAYELPENVTEVHEVYLEDVDWGSVNKHNKTRLSEKEYHALRSLILNHEVEWNNIFEFFHKKNISLNQLLMGEDFYHAVLDAYNLQYPEIVFSDFLWTMRSMYLPLFFCLMTEIPKADVYHAVATGYAGVLGSMGKYFHSGQLIISEHGIYTREREEELIKAEWVQKVYKKIWIQQFRKMSKVSYERADIVTSLYQHAQELQIELGCPKEKTIVTPNGINYERLSQIPLKEEDGQVDIGAVVRMAPIKDIKTMIYAFFELCARRKNVRLHIMGGVDDEEYAQECYTLVKQLKLENVIFTGRVDIVKYMEKLDFTILTSISEGQPLSVLESLAARRPCVTTDVGCCRELLEGKEGDFFGPAGYCVPPMYRQGLAAAMDKMCESRSLRLRMGANGQNRVNKYYRHERMMKEYKKLYGEVETAYGWNRI